MNRIYRLLLKNSTEQQILYYASTPHWRFLDNKPIWSNIDLEFPSARIDNINKWISMKERHDLNISVSTERGAPISSWFLQEAKVIHTFERRGREVNTIVFGCVLEYVWARSLL